MTLRTRTYDDEQYKLVPVEATEDQWAGLARAIVMAWDMNCKTPRKLFEHLNNCGRGVPGWLRNEPEMQSLDHIPSKGTRAVILYRAMLAAVPDTLPGVIEHSGEPVVWRVTTITPPDARPLIFLERSEGAADMVQKHFEGSVKEPLFTHPAPAQPVERQELTDELLCAEWMRISWFIREYCSIQQVLQYARAIIAKDRGQA